MNDAEFDAFIAEMTGRNPEEAGQYLTETAELFPVISDLEFQPPPRKKGREISFRPQSPVGFEDAFNIGQEPPKKQKDKFSPLSLVGNKSSSIPRPVIAIAAAAAARNDDEDEYIDAANNFNEEALDRERQLALQQREEVYVPRLIMPDRPLQFEGVDENYEDAPIEDDDAPLVQRLPFRNREGIKYGPTKLGRAFLTDPCEFESYEDYVSDRRTKRYRASKIWPEQKWDLECGDENAPAVVAARLQPVPPAPKFMMGRVPDYVKIRRFADFVIHKKGKQKLKNQEQLDAARTKWLQEHPSYNPQ